MYSSMSTRRRDHILQAFLLKDKEVETPSEVLLEQLALGPSWADPWLNGSAGNLAKMACQAYPVRCCLDLFAVAITEFLGFILYVYHGSGHWKFQITWCWHLADILQLYYNIVGEEAERACVVMRNQDTREAKCVLL